MKEFEAYDNRPGYFKSVSRRRWMDWKWQQANAVRSAAGLKPVFPKIPAEWIMAAEKWVRKGFRILMTPYALSLIERGGNGNPCAHDPVWKQVFPFFGETRGVIRKPGPDDYSVKRENWAVRAEMITPISQHKYDNRVIVYVADCCLGYCMYCFRSLQTGKNCGGLACWKKTVEEIRKRPEIEEVILSGGDPLVYGNEMIGAMLADLRGIRTVSAIRIHTRAWTYNPYRIDKEFCGLLKRHSVTEMGVHMVHPREVTGDFLAAVRRVRESGATTMLLCDTPLIKGVNDDPKILRELFMRLYAAGVKPYYLSHNMPNIPAAAVQRTSVKKGLRIMNTLKRRISNPAIPEYIITHRSGKKTVPECEKGAADFIYAKDKNGWPVIRFKDWKGIWQTYIDGKDYSC